MDINLHTDYLQYGQGNDILRFIINNGMVNISDVQNSMDAMKREEGDIILTNVKIFQFPHSTCRIIGQHALCGKENLIVSEYNYHRNRKPDQRKEEILSELPEFKNAKPMF